jgi:hypothetical protein
MRSTVAWYAMAGALFPGFPAEGGRPGEPGRVPVPSCNGRCRQSGSSYRIVRGAWSLKRLSLKMEASRAVSAMPGVASW